MENKLSKSLTINLGINSSRIKADGTVSLYIIIRVSKEDPVKILLPLSWPALYFDKKKRELLPRFDGDEQHPHYTALINLEKSKYWRVARNFYYQDKNFTIADIIKGVNTVSIGTSLGNYIIERSKKRLKDREIKERTRNNHLAGAHKLREYEKNDIEIGNISSQWLKKYLKWLLEHLDYGGAWSHMKTICTYVRDAKKMGIEIHETFEEYKLAECDSDPVWLEKSELETLLDYYNDPYISAENLDCLRGFLFACFTGLRISDLKRFRTDWICENEIVFTPEKARITQQKPKIVKVPVIDVAAQFIATLGNNNLITKSEQKLNKRLKTIANIVGIDKKLTTHVARHTFGTSLAVAGVPVIVISKLMGHTKIETTMVYIHIAENIRALEMARLQNSFANFKVHRNTG